MTTDTIKYLDHSHFRASSVPGKVERLRRGERV
jgi:hypothetical protein